MGYRYHAGARAPIDAGELVADIGKIVAGAKFGRATTTFVESQRGKTPMRVSWTSPS